jgi:hypothetical protein
MARINKAEHARILQLVDVDRRKVTDVAAEYGCTPANIYVLLSKLRRATTSAEINDRNPAETTTSSQVTSSEPPKAADNAAPGDDLFSAPPPPAAPFDFEASNSQGHLPRRLQTSANAKAAPSNTALSDRPIQETRPAAPTQHRTGSVTALSHRGAVPQRAGGVGARLAKAGFGLATRTADGDESLIPFRSLEDLFAAIKPILRSAVRSPDPIWFSVQSINLSDFDSEAA